MMLGPACFTAANVMPSFLQTNCGVHKFQAHSSDFGGSRVAKSSR